MSQPARISISVARQPFTACSAESHYFVLLTNCIYTGTSQCRKQIYATIIYKIQFARNMPLNDINYICSRSLNSQVKVHSCPTLLCSSIWSIITLKDNSTFVKNWSPTAYSFRRRYEQPLESSVMYHASALFSKVLHLDISHGEAHWIVENLSITTCIPHHS